MSHLRQISPWTRAMLGVAALAAAAIAVTVATASGADSEGQGDVTLAPDPDIVGEFEDCMSEHGVDVPEPGEPFDGPPGVHEPSAEEKAAFEACEGKLPRPPHGAMLFAAPADREALEKLRDCMSEHGVELPDPGERSLERAPRGPSAEEREAFEACGDLMPGPPLGDCPPPPGRPPEVAIPQD